MREVRTVADERELARSAAEEFAAASLAAPGSFSVALAGGTTPRALYRLLSDPAQPFLERIPWGSTRFFFGDERPVPPDHPDSNYRMASESLLSRLPVPPREVGRFEAEDPDVERVARSYEEHLRASFAVGAEGVPRFDLILLGMGADGHTASLFPGSEALDEEHRLAAAPWVAKLGTHRFTLTPRVLNAAARVLVLVKGEDKAETLREVLEGEYRPELYPSQIVDPTNGTVLWIVDRDAGKLLTRA